MEADVDSSTGTAMSKRKILTTKKPVTYLKTRVMVMEAVENLNRNGGVSLHAIKKYIRNVHRVDTEKKAHSIQSAVRKAVANGKLVQMKGSGDKEKFKLPLATKDVANPCHFKPILTVETNDRTEKEGTEFQYECGFCDSSFSSFDLITEHTKEVHSDIQEFPCKYCGHLFLSEIDLYSHLVNRSKNAEEKPFKCHVCNGGFSRKKQLKKHFQIIDGEKENNSEEDEPIPDFRLMIIGALEFHLDDPMTCHGVSYQLINRTVQEAFNVKTDCLNALNGMVREGILSLPGDGTYSKNSSHLYWSSQEIKVGSGDLGKVRKGNSQTSGKRSGSAADKDGIESKIQRMDGNVTSNEDSLHSFSSFDLRDEHTNEVHSDIQEFPCKYCGQLFLSEIDLYAHLVNHSEGAEEKPFKCNVCNGGFRKKKQLKKHFQFFHGEKTNNNEEVEPIPDFRLMIIGALEFLTYPIMHHGASYELINRNVQEAFNVKTDCLYVLNEMVWDGIVSLSNDETYSKNSLNVYWSSQEIKAGLGDFGKVRSGNSERSRKRRRSGTDKDGTVPKRLQMDGNVTSNEDSPRQELSNEEIRFARSVVGKDGSPAFNHFSGFLITDEGKRCLEVLKGEGVLTNMSSILNGAGTQACKAFTDLYNLWFERGKKTQYFKTLENEGIKLSNVSSVLSGAGCNAAIAFKELYDLWFDEQGHKTQYLKSLEKEGISLSTVSSILSLAGSNAELAFKELYDLWFDEHGQKTQYLDTLKTNGVSLARMSSILNGAGAKAPKAFKELYDLWFNRKGNKTRYLRFLKREGLKLSSMSSILAKARSNAAISFKDLYDLWFEQGKKSKYLETLKDNGISLTRMSGILNGAGAKAPHAFKDLYDLWFNGKGKKTRYLKTLKREGIDLSSVSNILSSAGANSAKTFKSLYDLWFDEEGNKSQHLKTLEGQGISLSTMSSILSGAGSNAPKVLKELYDLWFDDRGKKTKYLKNLENEGINLSIISSILNGAGSNAAKAFRDLMKKETENSI